MFGNGLRAKQTLVSWSAKAVNASTRCGCGPAMLAPSQTGGLYLSRPGTAPFIGLYARNVGTTASISGVGERTRCVLPDPLWSFGLGSDG